MRWFESHRMRRTLLILVPLVLGILAVAWVHHSLQSTIVRGAEFLVSAKTGTPVKIASVSVDLRQGAVTFNGLRIYNPPAFPCGVFMNFSRVEIRTGNLLFFLGKPHIKYLDAELDEIVIVRNAAGDLNADALKLIIVSRGKRSISTPIDTVELSIGRVVYKDYTAKEDPKVRVYDVNENHRIYKNLPGMGIVLEVVIKEVLRKLALEGAAVGSVIAAQGVGLIPAVLAGPAILPIGAAVIMVGNDSAAAEVKASFRKTVQTCVEVVKKIGAIKEADEKNGEIKAVIGGYAVSVSIIDKGFWNSGVRVSARKYLLPQPSFAKSVLYQITEKLE